ncbi:uncharacterized protein V2V93DRAFT_381924 [Kockiozyma suomiensis]|uniref:uncharacterized protein n=1 Tax=Kockiozyma suomiensis TaxID=1337062 RepID=UPI003343EC4A
MKYAAALFTIVVVAFAALVSAALDERAYVTVTTLETITSCGPSVTNCPAKSTSVPYSNNTIPTVNTSTPAVSTFTGGANQQTGVAAAAMAGVLGLVAYLI